ncbi:MAG: hypothetical protein Q6362_008390 [Candidatus Wukongarchaeota archaeon]|nr:hypothetical protein [Candidatus Wukongarchaeota archaeon]
MTTIHVKEETWKKLNSLRDPGEAMGDVIERLLSVYDEFIASKEASKKKEGKMSDEEFLRFLEEFCKVSDEEIERVIVASRKSFSRGG